MSKNRKRIKALEVALTGVESIMTNSSLTPMQKKFTLWGYIAAKHEHLGEPFFFISVLRGMDCTEVHNGLRERIQYLRNEIQKTGN